MATLEPIGWLRETDSSTGNHDLYGTRYKLSSNECYTNTQHDYKIAVFRVAESSQKELSVSASISVSYGEELGGIACFILSVPTNISNETSVVLERLSNELASDHSESTSETFSFNVAHSGYLGVCIGAYTVGASYQTITINSVSYGNDSGSGSGSSDIANFLVATPSSPTNGASVYANAAVEFRWNVSKRLNTAIRQGSILEYRYGENGAAQRLGSVNTDIEYFPYDTGFRNNTEVQWRVKAAVKISASDLISAGYTPEQLQSAGYTVEGGSDSEGTIEVGEGASGGQEYAGEYLIYSPWSAWTTIRVGDAQVFEARVSIVGPTGQLNGSNRIVFKYEIRSDASITGSQCQYSLDGGYTWTSFPDQGSATVVEIPVNPKAFPAGTVNWRARAKANGSYTDNWATASFTVTYDGYGKIYVTQGPIKKGIRQNTRIVIKGSLKAVGDVGGTLSFTAAQFCWSSQTGSNYAALDMTISGNEASITIQPETFPTGLIQWYLKGTDNTNTTSETSVYTSYVLKNVIDSFPVRPVNAINISDSEIIFQWGYISENGRPHSKTEIQFSEDGITWETPIEISS